MYHTSSIDLLTKPNKVTITKYLSAGTFFLEGFQEGSHEFDILSHFWHFVVWPFGF
jgi:hypothetical protein